MKFSTLIGETAIDYLAKCIQDGIPVHIPGDPLKFVDLFSEATFWKAVALGRREGALFPRAAFGSFQLPIPLEMETITRALRSGNTVCVRNIDESVTSLRQVCLDAEETLGFPGSACVHCYLSPPGTGYSFFHLDPATAVTCQIAGHKTWKYAASAAVPWSTRVGAYRGHKLEWFGDADWEPLAGSFPSPEEQGYVETTLLPGDVLVIPPGVWHSVQAHESTSISLNLRLASKPALETVLDVVRTRCLARQHWRRPIPFATREETETGRPSMRTLEELRDLLRDLNAIVDDLAGDDGSLTNLWVRNFLGSQDELVPQTDGVIEESERLYVSPNIRPRIAVAPDGSVSLAGQGRILKFETASVLKVLKQLLSSPTFTFSELREWPCARGFDPISLKALLNRLVQTGFISRGT